MSDLTAEQLETGRRNLLSQLRHDLKRDLSEYPVDAATMLDLVTVLEGLAPLDRKAVDAALRTVMTWVDYDLHKSLERDEETGQDTYGEHVDRFIATYERETGS